MKIGIVGLGIMSRGMAQNFLKHDYEVFVWNRTKSVAEEIGAEGAVVCSSPAEVCGKAELVFEVTANDESSQAVWQGDDGILSAADKSKVLVASATLSVDWIDQLAKLCEKKELTFFDMPLTGGRVGAESGNLTMLVGGDESKLDELRPTLDAIAGKVFHFGPAGQGTRYKLLLNTLQAIHLVGYGEVIKIAEASGMDIEKVGAALADRPGGVMTEIARSSYHNQPDPITFSVEWITKDLGYAREFAGDSDAPLLDGVLAKFQSILDKGQADKDWTNVNE